MKTDSAPDMVRVLYRPVLTGKACTSINRFLTLHQQQDGEDLSRLAGWLRRAKHGGNIQRAGDAGSSLVPETSPC